jgi:hypothetical protein
MRALDAGDEVPRPGLLAPHPVASTIKTARLSLKPIVY